MTISDLALPDPHDPEPAQRRSRRGRLGSIKRRLLVACAFGVVALGLVVGVAVSANAAGTADTIKIGEMSYLSGPAAPIGEAQLQGAKVGAAYVNAHGGVNGQKLEIVALDIGSTPAQAVQDFRTFSDKGIKIIVGFDSSDVCLDLGPIAKELNIIYIGQCSDPGLLGKSGPSNFFMAANVVTSYAAAAARLAATKYPNIKTWDVFSLDYVTGHSVASAFQKYLKKYDKTAKVGTQVFAPLTATDVTSYLSALAAQAPVGSNRGFTMYNFGSPSQAVYKQGLLSGLFDHYKAFVPMNISQPSLDAVGSQLPTEWSSDDYCPCPVKNPIYRGIAAEWQKMFKKAPNQIGLTDAHMVLAVAAAMKKAKSTDAMKVKAAMNGLTFASPKGPITIRNNYFVQGAFTFHCKGTKATSSGWVCTNPGLLSAKSITPAELLRK